MPAGTYRPFVLHFAFKSPPSQARPHGRRPNEILTRSPIRLNEPPFSTCCSFSLRSFQITELLQESWRERGQPPCRETSFHSIVSSISFHRSALGAGDHQWGSGWRPTAKNWLESSIMFRLSSLFICELLHMKHLVTPTWFTKISCLPGIYYFQSWLLSKLHYI